MKKLKLIDRLLLPSILPQKSDFVTLKIVKDINEKVDIAQDEIVKYEIKAVQDGVMGWNKDGSEATFEIEFTELENGVIKKSLEELDEKKELRMSLYGLVEAFL